MQEAFIQLVWQLGYFNKQHWHTAEGDPITIYHPGLLNRDAGPDFKGARLKIGALQWHGDVELHLKSSGWQQHRHQLDPAYNKVVLHVVLEDDGVPALRQEGGAVPVASLQGRIAPGLEERYQALMASLHAIPCEPQLPNVDSLTRLSMLDRTLMQRLQRKAEGVLQLVEQNRGGWEEASWQFLARGFGFKKNAEPMEALARRLPHTILLRHAAQPGQVEALLFGMAGLLEGAATHPWVDVLQREWKFLQHKWELEGKGLPPGSWLFSRLRPANFPSLRLAQLAALLQAQPNLFSFLLNSSPQELLQGFAVEPSAYWQTHYHFGKESKQAVHGLGHSSAENLLINTVAPLRVAWGRYTDQQEHIDAAVELLQALPAEDNRIIRYWKGLNMPTATAADSQALLELYNEFCTPKRCLHCSIGLSLLRHAGTPH
ncbi:DUF2851 family protein [Cesiribacter andamanensis]|uniref:DUF2851 domain-containing protein n=1 Tax=Cesiribacter andamanensis AMV16 TaxID=1279009 RepID=M7N2S5_9BACT|nr:DUF2851 family protein [Cesiribacter andamanensis]EMR01521.1 hypothetical protein ADICEAN_03336 [Cesiribacter andamanensis AMV16]